MLKAFAGKGDFPKIRTFNKSDISTNSVYKDLEAAEKMYVIFPSPRFYNNSIVTVSKRRNLVLICYGGKRYIENDFKIITKKILKCKSIYIPYEGYLINRYCILHEKRSFTVVRCNHLFWCCTDLGLNGMKTGDILLCFNPCMLELLPFVVCW